jgi:hypothetical protein
LPASCRRQIIPHGCNTKLIAQRKKKQLVVCNEQLLARSGGMLASSMDIKYHILNISKHKTKNKKDAKLPFLRKEI